MLLLILFCSCAAANVHAQAELFAPGGTMTEIHFSYDTILHVKKYPAGRQYLFAKLDTAAVTDKELKHLLTQYAANKADTASDYFFLANYSVKPVVLGTHITGKKLSVIQIAKQADNGFRPVNYIVRQRCCIDCTTLELKQGDVLVIKKPRSAFTGSILTQSKIKLSKTLVSEGFSAYIDPHSFYINSDFYKDYIRHNTMLYFLDR